MQILGPKRLNRALGRNLVDKGGAIDLFSSAPLDLRFALLKTLDPRVTFTRASSGTYVGSDGLIKSATTNEARFDHNPTTGESLGLLVEEARTNLLLRSEEFDNASWTKSALLAFGSGSTANAIAGPSGAVSADLLTEDTATTEHFVEQNFNTISGTTYAFSVFVKAGANKTTVTLRLTTAAWSGGANNQVRFNLSTGASTIIVGSPVAFSQNFGNGWWRFTIVSTTSSTGTPSARIHLTDSSGNNSYTGDGTSGIYLWGAQLEAGAFPTSYIPTTTATVTRAADVASITGSAFTSFYNQTEGTVYGEGALLATATGPVFVMRDPTAINRHQIGLSSAAIVTGNVVEASFSVAYTAQTKSSFAYALNNAAFTNNLTALQTDTSCLMPTGVITASIGRFDFGGLQSHNGTIKRLTYWPTRLANTTLQRITQ